MAPKPRRPRPTAPGRPTPLHALLAALATTAVVLLLLPPGAAAQGHDHDHPAATSTAFHERMEEAQRGEHHGEMRGETRPSRVRDGRCTSDCDCPPGQLCSPETARCETAFCPQVYRPVCGLDGRTYPNRCRAAAQHVVVAHEGSCDGMDRGDGELGQPCGGIAGIRCPDGQLCELPVGQCEGRDLQGQCVAQPEVCTEQYDPVCGCDGETYSNDCFRRMAGAQKAHDGECRNGGDGGPGGGPGEPPGREPDFCESNDDCPARAYCQLPGRSCEGRGRCVPRPDVCTKEYDPVCGCDGKTYGNACTAAANGVSISRKGRCDQR